MRRRLAALLLALAAVLGLALSAPAPAAALPGPDDAVEIGCRAGSSSLLDWIPGMGGSGEATGADVCEEIGDAAEKSMKASWTAVWDSVLGDVVNAAADVVRWVIKQVLTVGLLGPSLDLEATGLFGKDATLAGMLTWLGLVIAAAGAMWQLGKMALTGESKHLGRAALGWVESTVLSAVGVALIALLLAAGDAMTAGLVDATFEDDGLAYETIVAALVPATVLNPILMLGVVAVLLLIGFVHLIMVFLRQSAIPIMCLLLPVAGGGRAGGDVTRQWAPKLITAILVVITYKPTVAIILCVGFAEFGHAETLTEWLRGCSTLVLAIVAPAPLTRIFAPFGAAVGAGMASGGMGAAFAGAAGYFKGKKDGDSGGEGVRPMTPMEYARYVEQTMSNRSSQPADSPAQNGANGQDAQAQAARNEANRVPGQQSTGEGAAAQGAGADTAGGGANSSRTAGTAGPGATTGAGEAAAGAAIAIQVLDGVNSGVQGASGQIGDGGSSQ